MNALWIRIVWRQRDLIIGPLAIVFGMCRLTSFISTLIDRYFLVGLCVFQLNFHVWIFCCWFLWTLAGFPIWCCIRAICVCGMRQHIIVSYVCLTENLFQLSMVSSLVCVSCVHTDWETDRHRHICAFVAQVKIGKKSNKFKLKIEKDRQTKLVPEHGMREKEEENQTYSTPSNYFRQIDTVTEKKLPIF